MRRAHTRVPGRRVDVVAAAGVPLWAVGKWRLWAAADAATGAGDEAVPQAATELVEGFVAAFNAHDAGRFTDLFTENAWYTDVVGHKLRGRHEIAKAHSYAFIGPLESTHLDVQKVDSRLITPGVAHVEVVWRSTGHTARTIDAAEDLPEQRHGLLILTLVRESPSHRWAVNAGANRDFTHTYIADEPAFTALTMTR